MSLAVISRDQASTAETSPGLLDLLKARVGGSLQYGARWQDRLKGPLAPR